MNIEEATGTFRTELRTLTWDGETVERLPRVTRRVLRFDATVTAFDLDESNADEAIREEVAHFASLERSFEWKVFSFDRPPDLVDRLRTNGFEIEPRESLLLYNLEDGLEPFPIVEGIEVHRVESEERLAEFRSVAEAAFGRDYSQTTAELAACLRSGRRGHDAYVAYLDGVPASVGRLYTSRESAFAGFYGGGTRPEFRGRGAYRAVVAARVRDALRRGARYLQVDALPTSEPVLRRLGFVHVADTWPCASPPLLRREG